MAPRTFCPTCVGVIQRLEGALIRRKDSLMLLHHKQAANLRSAAMEGCPICFTFWSQLTVGQQEYLMSPDTGYNPINEDVVLPDSAQDDDEAWEIRTKALEGTLTWVILQTAENLLGAEGRDNISLSVAINPEHTLPGIRNSNYVNTLALFVMQPITADIFEEITRNESTTRSNSTRSRETWLVVEQWLRDCVDRHTLCNTIEARDWYPSRLLNIGHDSDSFRLVETASEPVVGRYITLSHCWGQSTPLRLLRSTRVDLLKGMKLHHLPQSFCDAIEICRRLQVSYIWIDSMCIVQDSEDSSDWFREAGLMHKVYSNSFLNISALGARDSTYSFFANRDPALLDESFIDTSLDGLSLGTEVRRYRVTDMMFWHTHVGNANLNRRGWVLQERLLAPRVLHFGSSQVYWECRERDAAESYTQGLPHFMEKLVGIVRVKDLVAHFADNSRRENAETSYNAWSRIVSAYSSCSLTVAGDKLIALSGIAKYMAATLQDEYVVGMWRRSLPWELTWHVQVPDDDNDRSESKPGSAPIRRRAREYRAPSFSWMSVDGAISPTFQDSREVLIEVLDVQQTFMAEDRTGLICDARLTVRGHLLKISMKDHPNSRFKGVLLIEADGTEVRLSNGPEYERIGPVVYLDEQRAFYDPTASKDLYLMPALLTQRESFATYLLLELASGMDQSYRRIGIANSIKQEEIEILSAIAGLPSNEVKQTIVLV